MATPRSSILDHPRRAAIDAALDEGQSIRRVAARFGVSKDALHRYRSGATRCTTAAGTPPEIPAAAPSPTGPAGFSPQADPFDLTSARYPWPAGETPRPDPLAERLRIEQRQSGTRGVRSAVLGMIGQYQAAGLTDEMLARKLDVPPALVSAWRAEEERAQLARLSRDPRSLVARELAAIEQRERRANQHLLNPNIGERAEASCNAVLNQCARQKIALLQAAGVRLALPPHEPRDHRTTLADMLKAGAAELMVGAGASPDSTLDQGLDQLGKTLSDAWAAIDREDPPSR